MMQLYHSAPEVMAWSANLELICPEAYWAFPGCRFESIWPLREVGLKPEASWLSHLLEDVQQHAQRQAMQMLQRPKEGRVNVSCRLRGTCKHRGCYQAWVVSSERAHKQGHDKFFQELKSTQGTPAVPSWVC